MDARVECYCIGTRFARCGRSDRASLHWEGLEEGDVGGLGFGEGLEVGLVGEVVLEVLSVAVVVGGGGLEVAFVVFVAMEVVVDEVFCGVGELVVDLA